MQKRLSNPFTHPFLLKLCVLMSLVFSTEKAFSQTSNRVEGYYLDLKKDTIRGFFNFDDL
jgi:hypothetical protein